ncbi:MAG TPA: hypothetical protein VMH22_14375 [bacterium]|nr:hypothetical protein [bacterium]
MRIFKRLFPILALVTLTSVVSAMPAGPAATGHGAGAQVATPQFGLLSDIHPNPRLYFGTVVRDTSDEQSVPIGTGMIPSTLQQQIPMGNSARVSLLCRIWVIFQMVLR